MKEEDSNPLEPVGDEPIEARIVAWVLGDASAFEAAELERLCAERPELLVFRHRMRALHGLLTEAEAAGPDEAWKLPAGKRAKIEELFGAMHPEPVATVMTPKRSFQPWLRQVLLASAACIVLVGGFYSVVAPMGGSHKVAANAESASFNVTLPPSPISKSRAITAAPMSRAEGYASASPVLPPLGDLESQLPETGRLSGASGLGGGMGSGTGRARFRSAVEEPKALADNQSQIAPATPFPVTPATPSAVKRGDFDKALASGKMAQRPEENIEITREFKYPTESEAPELPAIAGNDSAGKAFQLKVGDDAVIRGGGRADVPTDASALADNRNSIDAVLSNPNLPAPKPAITAPRAADEVIDRLDSDATPAADAITSKAKQDRAADSGAVAARTASERTKAAPQPAPALAGAKKAEALSLADFPADPFPETQPAPAGAPAQAAAQGDGASGLAQREMIGRQEFKNAGEIRKMLYLGEGNFNLGKYDDAKREFQEALRVDPTNTAARRWLERLASAKSDYYRAAYDHTRAELLTEVDKAWEQSVPSEGQSPSVEDLRREVREQEARVAQKQASPLGKAFAGEDASRDSDARSVREMANSLEQEKIQLESQLNALRKSGNGDLSANSAQESIESKLALTKDSLAKANALEGHKKGAAVNTAISSGDYPAMKREYEAALKELRVMKVETAGRAMSEEKQKRITDQEDKVEERLKLLTAIVRQHGIVPGEVAAEQAKLEALKQRLAAAERKATLVPTDETSAVEEPFSTFSLHVSDASFKLAKAALDRGERLSADQIRVEEFYNAFDYGDAAPAPGEAVACAIEQGGHPVLPQRNLVRVAMRVGSTGRAEGQPLNLTVLLDNSGSMEREDRSAGLKAAIGQLASLLKAGDSVTLAGFSRTPHLLADRLPGEKAAKLVELVDGLPSAGGTNLEEALKLAGELAVQRKNPAAQNRIVLLTDGAANLGNAKPEDLAEKIAALRQQGIAFDAAGIGAGGLNDRMLEALTRNGNGRYYIVNDLADADERFAKQLAGAFRPAAENVKVQVRFNPERVARYKLIGFEKHRLNKEDFHNDSVDAAEMAADEAGVALYQIETLPQGRGEIGEVSVRFKDAAAGQMVERSWTIPHDEKTPAFDQASPSLQLAGLSMLAAEKLRGGPLADATDFSSLAPQIARVRSYYGTSSRVGELVEMTGKLK